MAQINFNELLAQTQHWVMNNRRLILSSAAGIVVLALGLLFFFDWRSGKEKEASFAINNIINQVKQIEYGQDSLGGADSLKSLRDQLVNTYNQNKGLKNGRRALYLAGNIDFRLGDFVSAKSRYLEVSKKKSHYLAGAALYQAAICAEEEGKFDEAVGYLEDFDSLFFNHELYPDSRIALSRNQSLKNDSVKAQKILEDLAKLENGKYKEIASRELNLMRLRSQMSSVAQTVPAGR